jgi:hypothetical protein
MTTLELAGLPGFHSAGPAAGRDITGIYCADLLSWAMGRAPAGCAWCTIMGNINAVAVASLADVACIVLCEGAELNEDARQRAAGRNIPVIRTALPAFEAGLKIARSAGLYFL